MGGHAVTSRRVFYESFFSFFFSVGVRSAPRSSVPPTTRVGFSSFSTVESPRTASVTDKPRLPPLKAANNRLDPWNGWEEPWSRGAPGEPLACPRDLSHGEEHDEGCCISACLSAHPWPAAPPPRQRVNSGRCAGVAGVLDRAELGKSHGVNAGRARGRNQAAQLDHPLAWNTGTNSTVSSELSSGG